MKPWYYYEHINGKIIGKNPIVVDADPEYFNSPFVKRYWLVVDQASHRKMLEDVIPKGPYCYTSIRTSDSFTREIKSCPFWGSDDAKEKQNNGYCDLLKTNDWDETSWGMLWDQCKDCNINED